MFHKTPPARVSGEDSGGRVGDTGNPLQASAREEPFVASAQEGGTVSTAASAAAMPAGDNPQPLRAATTPAGGKQTYYKLFSVSSSANNLARAALGASGDAQVPHGLLPAGTPSSPVGTSKTAAIVASNAEQHAALADSPRAPPACCLRGCVQQPATAVGTNVSKAEQGRPLVGGCITRMAGLRSIGFSNGLLVVFRL